MSAKVSHALKQTAKQTPYNSNLLCYNIHYMSKTLDT